MLKSRIIPTLLMRDGMLVKGKRFSSDRRIGPVLPMIRVYESREVDELILLDVAATPEGRGPDFETIKSVASECFMPLTVGGGVRDLDTISELLRIGADKVAIGTRAIDGLNFMRRAAGKFGAQCIVAAIDVSEGLVVSRCGTEWTGMCPRRWAGAITNGGYGAGEILLTSVDRDGTMEGYYLDLIRSVAEAVSIPVIASGGARDYADFNAAFNAGAHAVAASALFQFSAATPLGAKQYLAEKGVSVRL